MLKTRLSLLLGVVWCFCTWCSPIQAAFIAEPYLQNVKTDGITVMWICDVQASATFDYGLGASYGQTGSVTSEALVAGSVYVYKCVLVGLMPDTDYHYRVTVQGSAPTSDRTFTTAPETADSFSFGVWADSQGTNHVSGTPDAYEPTKSMMRHMAQRGVDIAVTAGDLAESGGVYSEVRRFFLDRVARYLGRTVPWFIAWGNHDVYGSEATPQQAVIRRTVDLPSKDRTGYPGWGTYSFDYAGCHFVCIDHNALDLAWVATDLQSEANLNARYTFVFVHEPPYCELWNNGNGYLRNNLVPLMEQYGVDACFSGHTHEYERGYLNGVYYCITGGGSWLDFPEALVQDWPHMTVGGYSDIPGFRGGLVNEYVEVIVTETGWSAAARAFESDGTYLGVIDVFGTVTDQDEDGLLDVDEGVGDPDDDGLPNYLDTDSDGDGVADSLEARFGYNPYDGANTPQLPIFAWPLFVIVPLAGIFHLRNRRASA